MSVPSPCEICNRADVDHVCDRCGQLVCSRHFDEDVGLCIECAAAIEDESQPENIPSSDDMPDGVDTYRY